MDMEEECSGGAVKRKRQILFSPKQTQILSVLWDQGEEDYLTVRGISCSTQHYKTFPSLTDLLMDNCQFLQYTQFCSVFDGEPWWTNMTKEGLCLIEGSNVNMFTPRSLWNIMNICTSAKSLGTWRLEGPSFCKIAT